MKNILLLFLYFFVFFSCSKEQTKSKITGLNNIEIITAYDKPNQIHSIFDLLEVDEIIKLETTKNNLIGKISRICIVKDNIFVFDPVKGTILNFDRLGNFNCSIGRKGRGPTEYIHPIDFKVDTVNRQIVVLDNQKQIFRYNLSGEFVQKITIPVYASRISLLEDNNYLLSSNQSSNNGRFKQFFIVNKNGKIMEEGISFPEHFIKKSFGPNTALMQIGNEHTMSFGFNDTIYSYKNKQLQYKYVFDFGKDKLDLNLLKKCNDDIEVIEQMKKKNSVFLIHHYLESSIMSYAGYWQGSNTMNSIFYTKQNRKAHYYNGKNLHDMFAGFFVDITDKGQLIKFIDPYYHKSDEFNFAFRKKLMDQNYKNNASYNKYKKLITEISVDENPVIVLFKLKAEPEINKLH